MQQESLYDHAIDEGKASNGSFERRLMLFYASDSSAQFAVDDRTKTHAFFFQGLTISDELCIEWFDLLDAARRESEFRKGSVGIVGTLTATAMGLFSAAPNEIGAVAAAFGATQAWWTLGQTTFLFTPDLTRIKTKIQEVRTQMRSAWDVADALPPEHAKAAALLIAYHDTCSPTKVQEFINTAANYAKFTFDQQDESHATQVREAQLWVLKLRKLLDPEQATLQIDRPSLRAMYVSLLPQDSQKILEASVPQTATSKRLLALRAALSTDDLRMQVDDLVLSIATILTIDKEIREALELLRDADQKEKAAQSLSTRGTTEATNESVRLAHEVEATRLAVRNSLAEKEAFKRSALGVVTIVPTNP